jgi:hypothetical protein
MSKVVTPEREKVQQKITTVKLKESEVSKTETPEASYACTIPSQVLVEDLLTLLCRAASLHQDSSMPQEQQDPQDKPEPTVNFPIQNQTVNQQTVIQQFITTTEQLNFDVFPRKIQDILPYQTYL